MVAIIEPNSSSAVSRLKSYFNRKATELPNRPTDTWICQLCKNNSHLDWYTIVLTYSKLNIKLLTLCR